MTFIYSGSWPIGQPVGNVQGNLIYSGSWPIGLPVGNVQGGPAIIGGAALLLLLARLPNYSFNSQPPLPLQQGISSSARSAGFSDLWCCYLQNGSRYTVQGDYGSALNCCQQLYGGLMITPGRCETSPNAPQPMSQGVANFSRPANAASLACPTGWKQCGLSCCPPDDCCCCNPMTHECYCKSNPLHQSCFYVCGGP
jgi:hypothetical protein